LGVVTIAIVENDNARSPFGKHNESIVFPFDLEIETLVVSALEHHIHRDLDAKWAVVTISSMVDGSPRRSSRVALVVRLSVLSAKTVCRC